MGKRKKLRLKIFDESHLVERRNMRFSWWRFWLILLLICCFFTFVGIAIVWTTPLKTKLPGYMKESQRSASADMLVRLDSLIEVQEINQQYIDNVRSIIAGETVNQDSIMENYRHGHFNPGALKSASDKEINFVLTMKQKDEKRRQAAASAESGHIDVRHLAPQATATGDETQKKMSFKLADESAVSSIGDGVVLVASLSPKNTISVLIQHPGGYLSRVEGLSKISVKDGDPVKAGDRIGTASGIIGLQMWKDGVTLTPAEFMSKEK